MRGAAQVLFKYLQVVPRDQTLGLRGGLRAKRKGSIPLTSAMIIDSIFFSLRIQEPRNRRSLGKMYKCSLGLVCFQLVTYACSL